MDTRQKNYEIYARRSNLTHRWSLGVRAKGGVVSSEMFVGELRSALGWPSREGERLAETVRRLLLDHLREGDSVVLFDVAKMSPQLSLHLPETDSEAEALLGVPADGTQPPVKVSVKATPRTAFARHFARSLRLPRC